MRVFSLPAFSRRRPVDGIASPDDQQPVRKKAAGQPEHSGLDTRSMALVLLPAYGALLVAVGAGSRALTYEVESPEFTWKIWLMLIAGVSFSYVSRCGTRSLQRLYGRLVVLFIIALPLLAISGYSFSLVPADAVADSNTIVAVLMNWIAIASVCLVGARYGGSPISFTAPLVPTLSLFGLLNSISVNTVVSVSFLVFVVAALYLVAYERMLNQEHLLDALAQDFSGRGGAATGGTGGQPDAPATGIAGARAVGPVRIAPTQMRRTALQYLVACGVWFAICVGGATLIYYPLQAALPTQLARTLTGVGVYPPQIGTWQNPTPVMELAGGNHALSARAMLRVTIRRGESTGLWRGRVYERYAVTAGGSYWEQRWRGFGRRRETGARGSLLLLPTFTDVHADAYTALPWPAQDIAPGVAVRRLVEETIEPLGIVTTLLHTSGEPLKVRGELGSLWTRPDGTVFIVEDARRDKPYSVISRVIAPREAALRNAPGLSAAALEQWRADAATAATLELPATNKTDERLREIARRIKADALAKGRKMDTPFRKALAIGQYLETTCTYSLQAPAVPAGQDATLFFLTESHWGACDMFASAEALLLRALDVPARVATGFLQPATEAEAGAISTAGSASSTAPTFVLRERDRHAWVEYFVPATGWLTYDATPPGQSPESSLGDRVLLFLHWNDLHQQWRLFVLPAAGLLLLLVGGAWTLLDMRGPRRRVPLTAGDFERGRITSAYAEAVRTLSRHVPRTVGQTAQDYEAAVSRSPLPSAVKIEFAALTHLFVAAHYAPHASRPDALAPNAPPIRATLSAGTASPTASSATGAPPLSHVDAIQLRECVGRLRQALKQKSAERSNDGGR
jgi:transglutaminase-like putative cysteine protease